MEAIIKEVKIGGSLDCSDHVLAEFVISRIMGLAKTGVRMLNFRRANIRLFKKLLMSSPSKLSLGHRNRMDMKVL